MSCWKWRLSMIFPLNEEKIPVYWIIIKTASDISRKLSFSFIFNRNQTGDGYHFQSKHEVCIVTSRNFRRALCHGQRCVGKFYAGRDRAHRFGLRSIRSAQSEFALFSKMTIRRMYKMRFRSVTRRGEQRWATSWHPLWWRMHQRLNGLQSRTVITHWSWPIRMHRPAKSQHSVNGTTGWSSTFRATKWRRETLCRNTLALDRHRAPAYIDMCLWSSNRKANWSLTNRNWPTREYSWNKNLKLCGSRLYFGFLSIQER